MVRSRSRSWAHVQMAHNPITTGISHCMRASLFGRRAFVPLVPADPNVSGVSSPSQAVPRSEKPSSLPLREASARGRWVFGRASKTLGNRHPKSRSFPNHLQFGIGNIPHLGHDLTELYRVSLHTILLDRHIPFP